MTLAAIEGAAKRRGRPRKVVPVINEAVAAEFKAAIGNDADTLAGIVDRFKAAHPDKWEAIRLCATQHGYDEMIECLRCS